MHNHIQFVQEARWIDDAEERAALIGKIDAAAGHDVDVNELTEKEERGFIDGWENEGGFMDDCVSDHPFPWYSPWYSGEGVLKLRGDTPAEWGASYFRQVKAALMAVVRQTCGCDIDELLGESETLEQALERAEKWESEDDEDITLDEAEFFRRTAVWYIQTLLEDERLRSLGKKCRRRTPEEESAQVPAANPAAGMMFACA
jgi:hypothetical protein